MSDPTADEFIEELIDQSTDRIQWARKTATELLEYATFLEERANSFRGLAAQIVVEARTMTEEIGDLLLIEFPFDDTIEGLEDEDESGE